MDMAEANEDCFGEPQIGYAEFGVRVGDPPAGGQA